MARARNIKPGFFKNEILGLADPLYSLLFEGLWLLADRAGRLEDRPLRIKAEIFPYRENLRIDEMLNWLQDNGFIQRYLSEGKACILVLEFEKHQNPHKNEPESTLPAPQDRSGTGEFGPSTVEVDATSEKIGTDSDAVGFPPEKIGSTRADPGFLIPDSLIPEEGAAPPATPAKKRGGGKAKHGDIEMPNDVDPQTWRDWLKLREIKRAPVTQTVINGAKREAEKAGMPLENFLQIWCRRGSQGLEADWLKPAEKQQFGAKSQPKSFEQINREAGWARWEEMTGEVHPERIKAQGGQVIDAPTEFLEIPQ